MKQQFTEKRQAILDAALILFTEKGFHDTPTSLIARRAGVAGGTLFNYFKTKEELIKSLFLDIKSEAGIVLSDAGSGKGDWREKLENVCVAFAEWGIENHQKIHLMQQFYYSPYSSKTAHDEGISNFQLLVDQITIGIKEGAIRNYPPELILSIISSCLMTAINVAKCENDTLRQHQILKSSIDLMLHGIIQN